MSDINVLALIADRPFVRDIVQNMISSHSYNVLRVVGSVPFNNASDYQNLSVDFVSWRAAISLNSSTKVSGCVLSDDERSELIYMLGRFVNIGSVDEVKKERLLDEIIYYWASWIEVNKINLVIFPFVPHHVFDYVIYLLSKRYGIKTYIFEKTFWSDRLLIAGDFKTLRYLTYEYPARFILPDESIKVEISRSRNGHPPYWTSSKVTRYKFRFVRRFVNVFIRKEYSVKDIFAWIKNTYPGFYFGHFYTQNQLLNKSYLWHGYVSVMVELERRKILKEYAYCASDVSIDIDKLNYIVFFLQVQPEKSTCPLGGRFYDQLFAIQSLVEWLPDNYKLIVREHPSQLKRFRKIHKGRHSGFYRAVIGCGALLANESLDKLELIKKSKGVITVAGSVAFEAYMVGIKSAYMGYPWFSNIDGIDKVASKEDLERFIGNESSVSEYKVFENIKALANQLIPGISEVYNMDKYMEYYNDWVQGAYECIDLNLYTDLNETR